MNQQHEAQHINHEDWTFRTLEDTTIATARDAHGRRWVCITGIEEALVVDPEGRMHTIDQFDPSGQFVNLAEEIFADFADWVANSGQF